MDNQGFRLLVQQRQSSKTKTTKEIAREAVEEEFRKKKRKLGKDGGGGREDDNNDTYSSDEEYEQEDRRGINDDVVGDGRDRMNIADDDEDVALNEPKWKKLRRLKKQKKMEEKGITKYRDRAKERREGKREEGKSGEDGFNENAYNKEMSKFLGGDEKHTHLVKGLDVILAEKVRREDMSLDTGKFQQPNEMDGEIDLESVLKESFKVKKTEKNVYSFIRTVDIGIVLERIKPKVHSTLGKSMMKYLQLKKNQTLKGISETNTNFAAEEYAINNISTGQSHRSTFHFSLMASLGDKREVWEMPKESIMSRAQFNKWHGTVDGMEKLVCTPLDQEFVRKLKSVFSSHKPKGIIGCPNTKGGSETFRTRKFKHDKGKEDYNVMKNKEKEIGTSDIFGDIGEYYPPCQTNTSVKV